VRNFHLRSLRNLRPSLTFESAKSMATAIIGARIDYCNSLLYGTTERSLNRLHKVQNATARIVHQASFQTSVSVLRQQLHWVPIRQRITYKLATPLFQGEVLSDPTVSSRTASRPPGCQGTSIYYRSTVLPTIFVHRLHLSGVLLLCTSSLELSWDIHKSANTFSSFRRCLKSELFAAAYNT